MQLDSEGEGDSFWERCWIWMEGCARLRFSLGKLHDAQSAKGNESRIKKQHSHHDFKMIGKCQDQVSSGLTRGSRGSGH